MFSFFKKDPSAKLKKDYENKLGEALTAQRNGDIKSYSMLTAEAEKIREQLQALEQQS